MLAYTLSTRLSAKSVLQLDSMSMCIVERFMNFFMSKCIRRCDIYHLRRTQLIYRQCKIIDILHFIQYSNTPAKQQTVSYTFQTKWIERTRIRQKRNNKRNEAEHFSNVYYEWNWMPCSWFVFLFFCFVSSADAFAASTLVWDGYWNS